MANTHTFATMAISVESYNEIAEKLKDAGYHHSFVEVDGKCVLDMNGIGLELDYGNAEDG